MSIAVQCNSCDSLTAAHIDAAQNMSKEQEFTYPSKFEVFTNVSNLTVHNGFLTTFREVKVSILKKILIAVLFGCLSLTVVSCDQQGPAEKAGEEIDEGINNTGEAVEDAGEAVEETVEDVNEDVKDATD